MRKRKPQPRKPNQIVLIITFIALVILLLFVRIVVFIRGIHERHFR
ncbi:MAG TPA: hypothetical protein VGR47_00995 [Terracidiphilus sp.]|nr:hypothetical protein [Terracidiphilus sp.]